MSEVVRGFSRGILLLCVGSGVAIGYLGWALRPEWPLVRVQWITMALGALVIVAQLFRLLLVSSRCWAAVTYLLVQGLATALTAGAAVLVFLEQDIVLDDLIEEDTLATKNAAHALEIRDEAEEALDWGKWLLVGSGGLQMVSLIMPFIVKAVDAEAKKYSNLEHHHPKPPAEHDADQAANNTDAYMYAPGPPKSHAADRV